MLAGIVAGLTLFLVVAAHILLTSGRPYDAGLIRDFPGSGLPDLATYAVSDNLGAAMSLLLVVTAVTGVIGAAGATVTGWLRHAAPAVD